MSRRRDKPPPRAADERRAQLDGALRAMLDDCPVPDRLQNLIDGLAESAPDADDGDENPPDDDLDRVG